VVAPAAQAGPQPGSVGPIEARAYYVENAATGEVLAARNPDARVPIASITKLMTVLVTLEHAKLSDVVTVPPGAAVVGESTIHVRAGERLTVRDLIRAALIQSANDAAYALALHVGRGDLGRFVAMMNAKAAGLGLRDTHFVRPDGLDAPGHVSSARDVTRLAWIAMRNPFVRATVREQTATIGGGRTLHTWNDLLSTFPHLLGVKTGHTNGAGWSEVAAARGRGTTVYATILGSPSRARRNDDLASLLAWGLGQYTVVSAVAPPLVYATAHTQYGRGDVRLVASRPLLSVVRVNRPLTERVVAARVVALPVRKGERLGEVRVYAGRRLIGSRPLVAERSIAKPGAAGRVRWYATRTAEHVWGWVR